MKQYAPGVHSALVSANIFYEESFSTHEWGQNDINVTTSGATADTNQSGSPPTSCRQSIHMNAVRIMTKFVAAHKEISSQHHLDDLVLRRVLPRLQVSILASAVILWTFGIPLLMHAFVEWLKEIKQRHASFSVVVIPTYLAIVSLWFMAAVYFLRFNFLLLGFTMYSLFQPLWLVPTALNTLWVWKSNADIDEIPPGYDEMPPGYLPVPCEAFPVHPVAAVLTIMYALCFVVLTALIPLLWRWHLLGFDIAFRCLTWVPTYDARRKLFKKQLLENIAKFCDREIMRRRRNVAICHVTQVHGNLSSINRLIACFAHDGIADWTPDPKKMNN